MWVTIVATIFTVWSFLIMPFLVFDVEPTPEVMAILIGRAVAWMVLLPYVAVFAVQTSMRGLRRELHERFGATIRPGGARLDRKIAFILLGGALVPGASIAITLMLVPEISPITGQPRSVVIITTLAGACVALALAFRATQSSTTAAFKSLLGGMRRVQAGDLDSRIAVETDDEFGRLGAGLNTLIETLHRSRAETEHKESERAHAATQFHEAQKREALGQLAAGIAHDFNNILAIIVMYSDTVQKRLGEDDPNHKRLAEVLIAAERGRNLISQILDFARDRPEGHTAFDLTANLSETLTLIGDTLARKVDVHVDIPEKPMVIEGDSTGLHQVMANLMINAVQAMPETGGRLEVLLDKADLDAQEATQRMERFSEQTDNRTQVVYEEKAEGITHAWLGTFEEGRYARIVVADTGTGMTADILRHVFDPYFTTKEVGEGTGLGLSAVAGIIASHGGNIHVETRAGSGTRFTLCIPLLNHEEPRNG